MATSSLIVPRLARPSYKQGYARNASESRYPGLWKGLVGLWAPSLGPTGLTLRDQSGFHNHGTLTNMDGSDWVLGDPRAGGYAIDLDGGNDHINFGQVGFLNGATDFSIVARVKFDVTTQDQSNYWRGPSDFAQNGSIALFFDDFESNSSNTNVFKLTWLEGGFAYAAWTATNSVLPDVWYSVVAVHKSGTPARVFINGVDATDGTAGIFSRAITSLAENDTFGLSSDGASRALNGALSSVTMYSRDSLPSEIQLLHARPNAHLTLRNRIFPAAVAEEATTSLLIFSFLPSSWLKRNEIGKNLKIDWFAVFGSENRVVNSEWTNEVEDNESTNISWLNSSENQEV